MHVERSMYRLGFQEICYKWKQTEFASQKETEYIQDPLLLQYITHQTLPAIYGLYNAGSVNNILTPSS